MPTEIQERLSEMTVKIKSVKNILKILIFCDKVSVCSPGYPRICSIAQVGLKLILFLPQSAKY